MKGQILFGPDGLVALGVQGGSFEVFTREIRPRRKTTLIFASQFICLNFKSGFLFSKQRFCRHFLKDVSVA